MAGESDGTMSALEQARAHARSQGGQQAGAALVVPSTSAVDLPAGVDAAAVVWEETLGAGGYSSRLVARDTVLRITDLEGDGCVQLLVYAASNRAERVNVADTVKVQWQAYLGAGALLLSDMGRALMTVISDTSGRHDCLCGAANRRMNDERYGNGGAWGSTPNARDLLALAAAKNGLGRIDVPPWINLFKGARVGATGVLGLEGSVTGTTHIELRAELDVLVLVANTPHPLDDRPVYTVSDVRCTAWQAARTDPDPFRDSTPERARAYVNTDEMLLGPIR